VEEARQHPAVTLLIKIGGSATLAALLLTETVAQNSSSLPTATEVFHLRSECAALGEKILEAHSLGLPPTSEISHYNLQTNRCYVELESSDPTLPFYHSRSLYDGQTGEGLAFTNVDKDGKFSGIVLDQSHRMDTRANNGWDDATKYIDAMMADDRKQ
jgi:hypothetical protein